MRFDPDLLRSLSYGAMLATDDLPRLVSTPVVKARAFPASMSHMEPWFRFDFRAGLDPSGRPTRHRSGWKVHLSVDVVQMALAWDSVLPLVAEEGILAKAAGPSIAPGLVDPNERQAGKAIVLYADGVRRAATPSFWRRFLGRIEDALRRAGVRQGLTVRGDRPVAGSAYCHVRDDRDRDGRYVSGIEAYDPFASESPFDEVSVRSELAWPDAVGSAQDRIVRRLDFVAPGWESIDEGYCLLADDERDAKAIRRALAWVEIGSTGKGDAVALGPLDERFVADRWHAAMEVRRAAALGHLIKEASGRDGVDVGVRVRTAGDSPPQCRLAFSEAGVARYVGLGLRSLIEAGSPRPFLDKGVLVVPYAGCLHDESVADRMARIAEDVAKASRDAPRGDMEPPREDPLAERDPPPPDPSTLTCR